MQDIVQCAVTANRKQDSFLLVDEITKKPWEISNKLELQPGIVAEITPWY